MHIFTVTYVKLYKLIDFFFFADLFGEHLGLYKIKSFYFIHDRTQYFYVCHVLTIVKWESHFYNGNLVWTQHWCFCTPPCLSTDMNLYLVCWASFHFSPKIDVHKTFLTRHKVWDQIQHAFCYHHHWIHTPFHENGCSVVVFFFSCCSFFMKTSGAPTEHAQRAPCQCFLQRVGHVTWEGTVLVREARL